MDVLELDGDFSYEIVYENRRWWTLMDKSVADTLSATR